MSKQQIQNLRGLSKQTIISELKQVITRMENKRGEKSLKVWNQANGLSKPSKKALQIIRSLECQPVQERVGVWHTPSLTAEGVVYRQEVFFRGFTDSKAHGLDFYIECTCPAAKECKHAIRVESKMDTDWRLIFEFFGMEDSNRFSQLWSRAQTVSALMERDSFEAA